MVERGAYRRIAAELRERIDAGELPAGALVPSEAALCERYDAARGTVRSALALLVEDGVIEVVPGRGRRVVGGTMVSPGSGAAYERVAAELRARLDKGEFGPTDQLPSEAQLMAEFGVSRNTVRRAYRELLDAGLVVVRHGAGAFPRHGDGGSRRP